MLKEKIYDQNAEGEKIEHNGKWRNVYIGEHSIEYGDPNWNSEAEADQGRIEYIEEWQGEGENTFSVIGDSTWYETHYGKQGAIDEFGRANVMFLDELKMHFAMPVGDA